MSVTTPVGRLSFPNLFKAEQINGEGKPKYSCTVVFEPNTPGLREMRDAVQKLIDKKWNGKLPDRYKDPFLDGDDTERPEYKGKVVVRFATEEKNKPQIVGTMREPISDPARLYSGCYVRVNCNPYTWKFGNKEGISFGLNHVQFVRDGGRWDGRGNAEDVFTDIEPDDAETDDMVDDLI